MRKAVALFATVAVVIGMIVGVGVSSAQGKITVGLVQIDLSHPFHIAEVTGAKEAAKRLGVDLKVVSGEGNLNKQIEVFENLVQQKVSAIAVNTIDGKAFAPAFEKAKAAGIPVLSLHNKLPGTVAMVGYDEIATGKAIAEFTVQLLTKRYGQPKGQVALLQGMLGSGANIFRTEGFVNEIKKHPNIKIVAMTPTDWDPKKAIDTTENYLVAYPDLDVIYGLSDGLTVPAANVVKNANKADQVMLVSVDGSDFALQAVKNGQLECTFLLGDVYTGFQYIWWATKAAKGESLPEEILIKGALVTKDNVDAVMKLVKDMKEKTGKFAFEKSLTELIADYSK